MDFRLTDEQLGWQAHCHKFAEEVIRPVAAKYDREQSVPWDVIKEAHTGYHTPVVQLHLRYGMFLFIASEVMFFVAWFWAFFTSALFPAVSTGAGNSDEEKKAQNQATKNITSEAMNRIMP